MGREARSADRWRQMSSSYHTAAERRGGGDGDGEDGDESPPSPPSPPPSAMRRAVRRVGALALGVVGLLYVVGLTGARFDDDDDDRRGAVRDGGRDGRDAVARAGVGDEAARVTATATATPTPTHPRVAFVAQKPSVQKTG